MSVPLLLLCLVASAKASSNGWQTDKQYKYEIETRTLSALNQVSNQYSGIVARGKVLVQPKSSDALSIKITNVEVTQVHQNLTDGFDSHIPRDLLHFEPWQMTHDQIELNLKNGVVKELQVHKDTPNWELNLIKSMVSLFQVDLLGEKVINSRINSFPEEDSNIGMFKTMENAVQGECEMIYSVAPLSNIALINRPELAPAYRPVPNENLIDVVKTQNFSNCDKHASFHFGFTGQTNWEPASNQMGQFLSVIIAQSLCRLKIM